MAGRCRHIVLLVLLLLSLTSAVSQENILSLGPWNLKSVSGELGIEGMYQQQNTTLNDFFDKQTSTYFIGNLKLNTTSNLFRPEIISFKLNGEYNPETRDEKYIVIPDRSEVRTLNKLDFATSIFRDKKINLTSWFNKDQSYYNRENLTNIKSDNTQWGCLLNANNKYIPFSIKYLSHNWDQVETENGRSFNVNRKSLQTRFTKTFGETDKHDLTYNYDDYKYTYSERNPIGSKVNRISLNNSLYFDENKKHSIRSHVTYFDQEGRSTFSKFDASEQLAFHLPYHLDLRSSYQYYRLEDPSQLLRTNKINTILKHQLYESLTSTAFVEYAYAKHSIYTEGEFKTGAEIRYTKKILFGQLNLGYKYYRYHNSQESESGIIHIINESHTLNDVEGIFLIKPYVDLLSVVITDINGAIFYEEGVDYIVNEINDHVEIFRIPGGQILQDQEILVNYNAIQPGTYHYEANNHSINASLSILKQLLDIYYRNNFQDFTNVEAGEYLRLNEFNQQVFGGRIYYKFITGGVEFDNYNSNLIPYKRVNYFLNLHFKISSKLILSANGTLRDYKLLATEVNHKYTNVSGRASYNITKNSKANLQISYLSQRGKNIDLDLTTARLEFVSNYRKMFFKTGAAFYAKNYTNSTFTYIRTYIQFTRKF